MKNILEIKNLSCSIENDKILKDVTLNIPREKVLAIFGDSGTGKTTLLKILSLLFREELAFRVSGEIFLNSTENRFDILKVKNDLWKVRRKIVYLSQAPNPLHMSIHKNVAFPLHLQGEKDKELINAKVIQAIKDVNLYNEVKHRLNSSALDLSGGQKQKLCIARALTLNPDAILLDEPTSSLDVTNKEIIEELIIELGKKYSIIVVSHDKEQISRIAEEYFECGNGNIISVDKLN